MRIPRAEVLAAALVGRPVRTYLWREVRIVAIEDDAVVVADGLGDAGARVPLADVQAGLDQLDAEGEVAVTIDALGPWAKHVGSMLVEVEGAAYGDAPARVVWSGRPVAG